MTFRTRLACLTRSTTCCTRGLPVSAAIIFPGKRVDAKRAGMTTVAAKVGLGERRFGSTSNCGATVMHKRDSVNSVLGNATIGWGCGLYHPFLRYPRASMKDFLAA